MHYEKFLRPSDPEGHKVWVLIEYVSWCCEAEGNLAGTISGKLAAVQYFHRLEAGVELPTTAPVLKSALKGIARDHVARCVFRCLGGCCQRGRVSSPLGVPEERRCGFVCV